MEKEKYTTFVRTGYSFNEEPDGDINDLIVRYEEEGWFVRDVKIFWRRNHNVMSEPIIYMITFRK